jgi:NADH-quinone oxidoreductase subunit F
VDVCEESAILGKKNFIHVIEQDDCTQCEMCKDICKRGAIVKAGEKKPLGPKKPILCSLK